MSAVPFAAGTGTLANAVTPAAAAFGAGKFLATQPVHFSKHRQNAHQHKKQDDYFENHFLQTELRKGRAFFDAMDRVFNDLCAKSLEYGTAQAIPS